MLQDLVLQCRLQRGHAREALPQRQQQPRVHLRGPFETGERCCASTGAGGGSSNVACPPWGRNAQVLLSVIMCKLWDQVLRRQLICD